MIMPPGEKPSLAKSLWQLGAELPARFPFLRNVLVLVSGTGLGVTTVLASMPVLSRMYSPDLFGALAVFTAVLSVLLTCSSLCYEMAVPLAEDDDIAQDAIALSLLLLGAFTLLVVAIVALFGRRMVGLLNCRLLEPYLFLLPLGVLGGGAYQILTYWALRKEAFGPIAYTRVSQGGATVLAQVSLGWLNGSVAGLLVGDLLGRIAGLGMLFRFARRYHRSTRISWQRLRFVAVRYVRFPRFNVAANVLTAISTNIPVLVLSRCFGPLSAGLYALTYRVLRAPMVLLGQAVGQAFFARAASLRREREQLCQLTERTAIALMTLGLPVFTFMMLDGPNAFAAVFGERWRVAGSYAQVLAPWFLLWLVANPLSTLLTIREWQQKALLYAALECIIQVAALAAGAWFGSDRLAIGLLGASAFCFSLVTLRRFFVAGHASVGRVLKQALYAALIVAGIAGVVSLLIAGSGLRMVGQRFALLSVLYAFVVWKSGLLAKVWAREERLQP
jgi:lipopolysaccharide exporter